MILLILNLALIPIAFYLYSRKDLLTYFRSGHMWLTWLAIGVITLMDELTSIFYAPSEALQHIGIAAIIFIPLTSLIIRLLCSRLVQIAEILDQHNLKGGGVYNFSYLVLGPLVSFVAVASILIDYILTAAISTVAAVENATFFVTLSPMTKIIIELLVVWSVAGLNIIGIRENVKVTFGIFLITAVSLLNLLVSGILDFDMSHVSKVGEAWTFTNKNIFHVGVGKGYLNFVAYVSGCILAYSGVESVLQTAKLSESWKNIRKAYTFLALSVGIFTPIISVLVLSSNMDFKAHRNDLLMEYARMLNGDVFAIVIAIVASITLIMAVNTACVASSELVERVAHRYGFHWIVSTNKRGSLYKVHIISAIFFSSIILMTQGQIPLLADMYAVGLVATFVINLLSLLIYNYNKGTKNIATYPVKRLGTILLFVLVSSCFVYLAYHKPYGFLLWVVGTIFCLAVGLYGTKRRAPEIKEIARGDTPMDVILHIAEQDGENVHIHFKRPQDTPQDKIYDVSVFVTFFNPRQKIPPKIKSNHFRIPFKRTNIFANIVALMHLLSYELQSKNITVHFGWPTSSWLDRLSTGVMVYQFMKLPKKFPHINFKMEKFKNE